MPGCLRRVGIGFLAAAICVLVIQQSMWGLLHVLELPGLTMPPAWPMAATPPFGVPKLVSLCFWGGMWGAGFGAVWRGTWLSGGICLALIAILTGYFIVGPLKGIPLDNAFQLQNWARSLLINGPWALATAFLCRRLAG